MGVITVFSAALGRLMIIHWRLLDDVIRISISGSSMEWKIGVAVNLLSAPSRDGDEGGNNDNDNDNFIDNASDVRK